MQLLWNVVVPGMLCFVAVCPLAGAPHLSQQKAIISESMSRDKAWLPLHLCCLSRCIMDLFCPCICPKYKPMYAMRVVIEKAHSRGDNSSLQFPEHLSSCESLLCYRFFLSNRELLKNTELLHIQVPLHIKLVEVSGCVSLPTRY
eukprot:5065484-Amphidinium_carterae.1